MCNLIMWATVATILGCYSVSAYPMQPQPMPPTGYCRICKEVHFNPCDPVEPPRIPIKVITDSTGNDSTS
ncbi:hypothetical protein PGT21_025607 [Puccinia graminis f. sp. tritici]|uniref:Uncharacterized protein n=1 Tax=Puccinia graminis f. sp. tritici TaxID=56615 RepID=A0A5B0P8S9_PUCGR|nr:hypothetical protein PGT21_025607 [Puccinia graminis f. sp. tritici]KAA1131718.1 hypothetical protein PGTUg99_015688 [Puccinia graminis f. sp. tritici]